jgi:hypothetical protein
VDDKAGGLYHRHSRAGGNPGSVLAQQAAIGFKILDPSLRWDDGVHGV